MSSMSINTGSGSTFPNVDPRIRIHYTGKVDPRILIHYSQMWIRGSGSRPGSTFFSCIVNLAERHSPRLNTHNKVFENYERLFLCRKIISTKKFKSKIQLVTHLKSTVHISLLFLFSVALGVGKIKSQNMTTLHAP